MTVDFPVPDGAENIMILPFGQRVSELFMVWSVSEHVEHLLFDLLEFVFHHDHNALHFRIVGF